MSYFTAPKRSKPSQTPFTPDTPKEMSRAFFVDDSYTPSYTPLTPGTPGTPSEQSTLITRGAFDASLLNQSLRQQKVGDFRPFLSSTCPHQFFSRKSLGALGSGGLNHLATLSLLAALPSAVVVSRRRRRQRPFYQTRSPIKSRRIPLSRIAGPPSRRQLLSLLPQRSWSQILLAVK